MSCNICPRDCNSKGEYCGEANGLRVALAALHFGEEPPLVGRGGSGTIFFSGCNMKCPFCQNWQISRGEIGKELSCDELITIMMTLQNQGAQNINFVTGSHFSPSLGAAVRKARLQGLIIPILWNSSAYESRETLTELEEHVDIWLPDLKTLHNDTAINIYRCKDYVDRAEEALDWMINRGKPIYDKTGIMQKGTIIRHLIIPGNLESTYSVLKWYAQKGQGKALLSLLSQYTPVYIPGEKRSIPPNYLKQDEYDQVLLWLEELDIEEGFIQELETGSDWLPDFNKSTPFSSELARVIWNSHQGYLV